MPRAQVDRQRQDVAEHENHQDGQRQAEPGPLQAKQRVDAVLHLEHAHGDRAAEADGDGDDRHQVGQPADGVGDPVLAEHLDDGSADQARTAEAEAEVGDHQTGDTVDRPGVQAPVEVRQEQGEARRLLRRCELLDRHVVRDRLGRAPEQQADAHAGGEQHGEPGDRAELRLVVVATELDAAIGREREADADDQDEADHQHDEPGAAGELHADQQAGEVGEALIVDDPPDGDAAGHRERDEQQWIAEHAPSPGRVRPMVTDWRAQDKRRCSDRTRAPATFHALPGGAAGRYNSWKCGNLPTRPGS